MSERTQLLLLLANLQADQRQRWLADDHRLAEAYFQVHPELLGDKDTALDFIYSEIALRQKYGESPQASEYLERFPSLADVLTPLFEVDRVIQEMHDVVRSKTVELGGISNEPTGEYLDRDIFDVQAGTVVAGRYKLLEKLGSGTFGTVWMSDQRAGVRRQVAIKLINPGMDSQAVLTRFEAERQALALMDHANIAKVLDGGTTEQGRPYFVMELVKGPPISQYCDQRRLSVRDRLGVFMQVCAAVQHAHQKGIIHRDLKPSNVLVTEHDGKPLAKVIDFGLAKALHDPHALTDRTLHTAFGTPVGTLLYMAPEQVGFNALDTDTRADVYALGVILYELLTGTTPLEKHCHKQVAMDEIRRLIRDEEPPRPSQRLSSSVALPSQAASRRTEPAKLIRLVRGDLDWIVLKALEKDRNRRYDTANALAMDVQRHLNDEPVLASPPSVGYRVKKFLRKHRRPVLAASVMVVLLIASVVSTTILLVRATNAEAATAQSLEQAMAAVDECLTQVGDEKLADIPQMEYLRKDILSAAREHLAKLLEANPTNPELSLRFAIAFRSIGDIDRFLEDKEKSRESYDESIRRLEELSGQYSHDPKYKFELAASIHWLAVLLAKDAKPAAEKEAKDEESAARQKHNRSISQKEHDRSIKLQRDLVRDYPAEKKYAQHLARSLYSRGTVYDDQSELDSAQKDYLEAIDLLKVLLKSDDMPAFRQELARCYTDLGNTLKKKGQLRDAEESSRKAVGECEQLVKREDANTSQKQTREYRKELALYCNNLANILHAQKESTGALVFNAKAIKYLEELAMPLPSVRNELANAKHTRGAIHSELGQAEAKESLDAAAIEFEKLTGQYPKNPEFWDRLGNSRFESAQLAYFSMPPDYGGAYELFLEAAKSHVKACELAEGNGEYLGHLVSDLHLYGFCCINGEQPKNPGQPHWLLRPGKWDDVVWVGKILVAWEAAINDESELDRDKKSLLSKLAQKTAVEMFLSSKREGRLTKEHLKRLQDSLNRGDLRMLSDSEELKGLAAGQ